MASAGGRVADVRQEGWIDGAFKWTADDVNNSLTQILHTASGDDGELDFTHIWRHMGYSTRKGGWKNGWEQRNQSVR